MARSNLPGKKIDTFGVNTEAGDHACEIRMRKRDGETRFSAHCPDLGLSAGADLDDDLTVDEAKAELEKLIRAAVSIDWQPYYWVRFKGTVRELPKKLPETGGHSGLPIADLGLQVARVDLAETAEGKIHRFCKKKYSSEEAEVHDGWPKAGLEEGATLSWQKADPPSERAMVALVPVTPETTAALKNLLGGFAALRKRLKEFLDPRVIDQSLTQLLGGPALPALPARPETTDAQENDA